MTLQVSPVPATPEDLPMRMAGSEPVALAFGEEGWAVAGEGDEVAVGALAEGTGAALAAALAGLAVTAHDAKAALRATGPALRPVHDTMVAAYLLEPRRRGYPLEELSADAGLGAEGTEQRAALDAALVRELTARQEEGLRRLGLVSLFREIELPLTRVLADMEAAGVKLDVHRLGEIAARVRDSADELGATASGSSPGASFVIESPRAARRGALQRLGFPTFRRGKTGVEHRLQGPAAAGRQAPDHRADRPDPRAHQARQHLPVRPPRAGRRARPPAHDVLPDRGRDRGACRS